MLEVHNIRFSYASTDSREFCFNLRVESGEIVVVEGASGAGKSTLLNLIAGFLTPDPNKDFGNEDSGFLRWKGEDIGHLNPAERPLSMIFQDSNLFEHLTCRQNIALGIAPSLKLPPPDWQKVDDAMMQLGISEFAERKPGAMSGGQQQRIALARALVRAQDNKELLLFDEPFHALDPETRQDCINAVLEVVSRWGLTALMVSHDPRDAKLLGARVVKLS